MDEILFNNAKNLGLELLEKYHANGYGYVENLHHLKIEKSNLWSTLSYLKNNKGFIFLIDQKYDEKKGLEILLLNLEEHQRILVTCEKLSTYKELNLNTLFSKIDLAFSSTNKIEGDIFGTKDYSKIFPALRQLYSEEEDRPIYKTSSLYEGEEKVPFVLDLEFLSSKVTRANLANGLFHIGLENAIKNKSYKEGLEILASSIGNYATALSYVKGIEECYDIVIPDKGKVLRMFFLELYRIYDHIEGLNTFLKTLRFEVFQKEVNELSRFTADFMLKSFGRINTAEKLRLGGISDKLNSSWIGDSLNFIKVCEKTLSRIQKVLLRNSLWANETNVFALRATSALEYGLSGTLLRACGVNYDLRKVNPIYFYQDVEFEIPLGVNGDIYDVYLVRFEEIRQSLSILNQILDNIPTGPTYLVEMNFDKENLYAKAYAPIEGARGECGVVVDIKEQAIDKINFTSGDKNFYHTLSKRLPGHSYREAIMLIRSGHLNIEEIDL